MAEDGLWTSEGWYIAKARHAFFLMTRSGGDYGPFSTFGLAEDKAEILRSL